MDAHELLRMSETYRQNLPANWRIVEMDETNVGDFNTTNEPFELFGRMKVELIDDSWRFSEELWDEPRSMLFPLDKIDPLGLVGHEDRGVLLAYIDQRCAGQCRFSKRWNRYLYIEDLAIAQEYRRQGLGRILILAVIAWARQRGFPGLSLEAQDTNLAACRFYRKLGFSLGGIDRHFYRQTSARGQVAYFWYLDFENRDDAAIPS